MRRKGCRHRWLHPWLHQPLRRLTVRRRRWGSASLALPRAACRSPRKPPCCRRLGRSQRQSRRRSQRQPVARPRFRSSIRKWKRRRRRRTAPRRRSGWRGCGLDPRRHGRARSRRAVRAPHALGSGGGRRVGGARRARQEGGGDDGRGEECGVKGGGRHARTRLRLGRALRLAEALD